MKVNRFTENIGSIFYLAMFILVLFQIVSRYVFSSPPPWSEEFARWAMVWSILIFGITLTRKNDHILMDFFVNFLPAFPKRTLLAVINGVLAIFFVLMAFSGYGLIQTSIITNQNAPGSGIPLFYVYTSLPVVFIFMSLASLLNAIEAFREEKR